MAAVGTYVRARIDTDTKDRAAQVLGTIGLSVSDAIRMLMIRVAEEKRLPFEVKAPDTVVRRTSIRPAARGGAGMIADDDFAALTIDTSGWVFDRDEANER